MVVRSYPFGPVDRLTIDPMYAWLRDNEPLSRVKLPYGDEAWLLVRYEDVRTALGDARFSRAEAVTRDVPRLQAENAGAILTDLDPPEHTSSSTSLPPTSPCWPHSGGRHRPTTCWARWSSPRTSTTGSPRTSCSS